MLPRSWRALAVFAGVTLVLAGCQEDLAGGAACPALCPDTLTVRDTVLLASEVLERDITLLGSPAIGTEAQLLVVGRSRHRLVPGVALGSTLRALLQYADCPVLVVPDPQKKSGDN